MGEFSDSFNTMVERLAINLDERDRREKELFSLNDALISDIAERKKQRTLSGRQTKKSHFYQESPVTISKTSFRFSCYILSCRNKNPGS